MIHNWFKKCCFSGRPEKENMVFHAVIGGNETNFPDKLLLTNRQILNLRKAFINNSSADIKLSKMIQSGGFLGRILGPLLKARFL